MAGYSAPPLFGLLGAFLLANGWTIAVLWTSVVLLVLLLTAVRGFFAVVYIALIAMAFVFAARHGTGQVRATVATTWVWLLLLGGLLRILQRGRNAADFVRLRQMTFVPALIWVALFALLALAALGAGSALLLGGPEVVGLTAPS